MRALGAIPQVMAFSDAYQALQTGVVDGAENTPVNIVTQKFHEVQKVLSMTHHGYDAYAIIVNGKFWDSLPADERGVLEQAMVDATRYVDGISTQAEKDAIDAIRRSGRIQVVDLTADERQSLKQALQPVYRQMEGRIGRDVVESVRAAAGPARHQTEAMPALSVAAR